MAEETLLSAARRVLRYFRIDEAHGGLTSPDTLIAMDTLALQVERESERQSAQAVAAPQAGAERPS